MKRGFTFVELLTVTSMILILSSVVIISLNNARAKARDAIRLSDMKEIEGVVELYFQEEGKFPNNKDDIHPYFDQGFPLDPQDEIYGYKKQGKKYCIGAIMEVLSNDETCDAGSAGGEREFNYKIEGPVDTSNEENGNAGGNGNGNAGGNSNGNAGGNGRGGGRN